MIGGENGHADGYVQDQGHAFGHDHERGLELGEEESLPWLESADDIGPDADGPARPRLLGFGLFALALLAAIVGGLFWLTHRGQAPVAADGSLIEAGKEPYKVAPSDPGGKTFAGTGDTSFKVSQGQHPAASLAGSAGTTPPPAAAPSASASASAAPAPTPVPAHTASAAPVSGVGVQVGAFSSAASAETAWNHLVTTHEPLKGLSHRVVEGKADIGTVYRLQAVVGDSASANSLCSHLLASGLKCQVKH